MFRASFSTLDPDARAAMSYAVLLVPLLIAQAIPSPDNVLAQWWEALAKYAFAGLLAFVAASLRYGNKLRKHDESLRSHITAQLQPINDRLEKISIEQMRMSAEVWGPQMNTGMRQELTSMRVSLEKMSGQMASVLAMVQNIIKQHNTPED